MTANKGLCFFFGINIIQSNRNQRWLSPVQRGKPPSGFNIFSFEPTINRSSVMRDIQSAMFRTSFPSIYNKEMGQNKIIDVLFGAECLWSIEKVKRV